MGFYTCHQQWADITVVLLTNQAMNVPDRKANVLYSLDRVFSFRRAPFPQVPPDIIDTFRNLVLQVPVLFQF